MALLLLRVLLHNFCYTTRSITTAITTAYLVYCYYCSYFKTPAAIYTILLLLLLLTQKIVPEGVEGYYVPE